MTRISQTGDTIVEVMIAMVVISAVLAGAFLVSRSSLKHVRQSEEHSQALNLVQGQVEMLREAALKVPNGSSWPGPPFCMNPNPVSITPASCTKNGLYRLSIAYDAAQKAYIATAQWDGINGGKDQVQLAYRVAFAP